MKQKIGINNLQELIDWIDNSKNCFVSEIEDEYLRIEAPNNADVFIDIEEDDEIDDIVYRAIERLEDFDTDERFMELWSREFAEHNHFTPTQFINMLKKDEEIFHDLAYNLRNLWQG